MEIFSLVLISSLTIHVTQSADKHVYSYPYEFIFRDADKNWNAARRDCKTFKAVLVKVDSAEITNLLAENFINARYLWIGASDNDMEGKWKWLDGSDASYTNWQLPKQPDNFGGHENCAIVYRNGKWGDIPCGNILNFICQKGPVYSKLYELAFREEKLSWRDAKAACENANQTLIKIDSEDLTNVITQNMQSGQDRWIGVSDIESEGAWKWLDGTSVSSAGYRNWAWGEPNDLRNEDCGLIWSSGKWNDAGCARRLKFICQKRLPMNLDRNGHIFTFHRQEKLSLNIARKACANAGERLLEIYDKETDELIRKNILYPNAEFIVGGTSMNAEITWDSGTESSYTGWATNHPRYRYTKRLVAATPVGWKDLHLRKESSYICEKLNMSRIILSPNNETAEAGVIDKINCTANGIPYPTVYWMNFLTNVTDSVKGSVYQDSAPGLSILHFNNAILKDETTYTCVAINAAGNYKKKLETKLTLTVPSAPEYVASDSGNCSSNLTFVWKPNRRALNIVHKLHLQNNNNRTDVYQQYATPTTTDIQFHTLAVRPWATFTISVTPCLQEEKCETKYTLTNQSRHMSAGLPQEVTKIRVTRSSTNTCTVTWEGPDGVPAAYITQYKMFIKESSDEPSSGMQRNSTVVEHILGGETLMYNVAGMPNSVYRIGVQAHTCLGPSDISWSAQSCIIDLEGGDSAVIGGAVGGGLFLLLLGIFLMLLLILRRRKRNGKDDPIQHQEAPYITMDEMIYENQNVVIPNDTPSNTDIPTGELETKYDFMQCNHGELFRRQFEELRIQTESLNLSTDIAANPALKVKNRFKNILPYDISRVPIDHNEDGYINACFIDGYQQSRRFIATQGPLKKTVNDFWLMVAERESVVIVMLAKCMEAGKAKCAKYWPEIGKSNTCGIVTVSNVNEVKYCGFVCRTFSVKFNFGKGDIERMVTQYHFLKWPDHGFPITTSYIMRMYQQVNKTHDRNGPTSPIIVHCSAGAGRTGTFIAYDNLLRECKARGSADVYECIAKLRRQRVEMVQNYDQYILVHKLLLESHLFGDTDRSRQEIVETPFENSSRTNLVAQQFQNLSRVKPMDMTQKKQIEMISAYDRMKVKYFEDGLEIMHPLSASFLEIYDDSVHMIVTRAPQQETAEIFYKLLFNFNVTAIVALTELKHKSFEYWNQAHGDSVQVTSEESTPYFKTRALIISDRITNSQKTITHIEIKLNQKEGNDKQIMKINEGVTKLQKAHRESGGSTVVHCKNGKGMSGVFCAAMNLLERLKVEDRVDVFRTVKDLRDCKEEMVSTQEEYELCYEAVLGYFHNFDTYSNFA